MEDHLLLQRGEVEGVILDLLPRMKREVFPLLAQPLQRGAADTVDADACRGDGVPRLLGGWLVRERHLHLRRNSGDDSLQRALIVVVHEVTVLDGILELARLHLESHEHAPLVVVGLRQLRPRGPCAAVLVHRLDRRRPVTASTSATRIEPSEASLGSATGSHGAD